MLTIRPIAAHELDGFARFSRDDELNAALKGEVSTLWEQGSSRLHISYVVLLALSPRLTKGVAAMAEKIDRREDVNPREGLREYGDVDFADPVNKKYPIDTPEHVRAAWSYINHKDNAAKYDPDEVREIKRRIKRAAEAKGVEISAD